MSVNKSIKCPWCLGDDLYEHYHDTHWGVPCFDEQLLFEFLILETFQAGLSWITILRKQKNFRKAFNYFDATKIAAYDDYKITELMQNSDIVRNQLKILATIQNAKCFLEIQQQYGSFSKFIWQFVNHTPVQNYFETLSEVPSNTPLSDEIAKRLKAHGFRFIGSTTIYAYMQSIGMVNDHLLNCYRHKQVKKA